jgi:hypothetical protein
MRFNFIESLGRIKMSVFEYKIILDSTSTRPQVPLVDQFNELGEEGYRLVGQRDIYASRTPLTRSNPTQTEFVFMKEIEAPEVLGPINFGLAS